ncbi:MAG: hypothetical protein R8K46_09675 [Mariprofundaceae bacterium]
MEFFSNYQWAIPTVFSDAISLCCFEEGDTFYDSRAAYEEDWAMACEKVNHSLQVIFPARSSSRGAKEGQSIFDHNWSSTVEIDLYTKFSKTRSITTTQGKLYTALWKGDLSFLDTQTHPSKPIRLKQVMKILDEVKATISNDANRQRVFVMPRDTSSLNSKQKFRKVRSRLSNYLQIEPIVLSPKKAGFKKWSQISPPIDVVIFPVSLQSDEELVELVKSAVYVPSKDVKKSMFRLASHGMVF